MARPRLIDDKVLLDAAMFTFWAGGYGATSTRELESATGLPASSLYHRFGNKEGLFVAALSHYIEQVLEQRMDRFLAAEDAYAGLRAFFVSVYRNPNKTYHACLMANTWNELGTQVPTVTRVLARGSHQLLTAFAANLRRCAEQGAVRKDIDPKPAARYLLMSLQGLLVTARGITDPKKLDDMVDIMLGALKH